MNDSWLADAWLADADSRIRADPSAIHTLFPEVGRRVGRAPLFPDTDPEGLVHGTVDDQVRARLLGILAAVVPAEKIDAEIADLYRYGDDAERRGVLRGLPKLPESSVPQGLELVADGLRTNDIRLVAAALGPFAAEHLDQHRWRHGVLKCLFVGVPLQAVVDLEFRADAELRRLVADYADERRAAGRELGPDVLTLLEERS